MKILTLGEKIRKIRKERNMTLKELAGDKVTQGQISLIESGKSNPSMDLLNYLSERLGVSRDYLMESDGSQKEKYFKYTTSMFLLAFSVDDHSEAQRYLSLSQSVYADEPLAPENYYISYLRGLFLEATGRRGDAVLCYSYASFEENAYSGEDYWNLILRYSDLLILMKNYNMALTYLSGLERQADGVFYSPDLSAGLYSRLLKINFLMGNSRNTEKYVDILLSCFNIFSEQKETRKKIFEKARKTESSDPHAAFILAEEGNSFTGAFKNFDKLDEILKDFSRILISLSRYSDAKDVLQRRLGLAGLMGHETPLDALLSIVSVEIKMKELNMAPVILKEFSEMSSEDLGDMKSQYCLLMAEYHGMKKNREKMKESLNEAYRSAVTPEEKAETSLKISSHLMEEGDEKNALEYLSEYSRIKDGILNRSILSGKEGE